MFLTGRTLCVAAVGLIWSISCLGDQLGRAELVAALDASISAGDRAALDRLLAANFRPHGHTDDLFRKPLTRELAIENMMRQSEVFRNLSRRSEILVNDSESLTLRVTETGVQVGPWLAQPPSGNLVAIQALETWKVGDDGKFTDLWRQADDLAVVRQITAWQPEPDLPVQGSRTREIAEFPGGAFLESIVADGEGNLYFTQLMTGLIRKLAPDGTVSTFAELPVGSEGALPEGVMCLVLDEDGAMFVTVLAPGKPEHGVWRIDRDGRAAHFAALPAEVLPNGIARDPAGRLYVADSGAGGVWQIDPELRAASRWYEGELLRRRPYIGIFPPANGIQFWNGSLYVANSDRALIIRIPVEEGGSPGEGVIHADGVGGDDFAVDEDGTLYVTTHPYNSVIRVDRNGSRTVVATPEQGLVGPTAAAFARRGGVRHLYVVTDGGLFSPIPGRPLRPAVVELDLSSR